MFLYMNQKETKIKIICSSAQYTYISLPVPLHDSKKDLKYAGFGQGAKKKTTYADCVIRCWRYKKMLFFLQQVLCPLQIFMANV